MAARLASSVLVGGLIRLAESQGGFGAIVAKGDATAGAIAVILLEKGGNARLFERALRPDGSYAWQETSQGTENEADFRAVLERKRRFDPDLWIVELDIANAPQLVAEWAALT